MPATWFPNFVIMTCYIEIELAKHTLCSRSPPTWRHVPQRHNATMTGDQNVLGGGGMLMGGLGGQGQPARQPQTEAEKIEALMPLIVKLTDPDQVRFVRS